MYADIVFPFTTSGGTRNMATTTPGGLPLAWRMGLSLAVATSRE
jgi:hypothetical protein